MKQKALVEEALEQFVPAIVAPQQRLNQAMRYSLMGGGKRLRPILVLATAEAVGGKANRFLSFACALECIHTYSLIHDDLPAMDNDDLRRGRPTCHIQFDEATAILAGDALLTRAFELAALPVEGVPASKRVAMIVQLAQAAGINGMVGGQMLDILAENRAISLPELRTIHRHKTGALIRISCQAGAYLAGGTEEQVELLKRYGEAIGLAFQITDDILDEVGDTQLLGKNTGQDLAHAKSTYPALMGLEQARKKAEAQMTEALVLLAEFGDMADPLRALARYIVERTH